MKRILPIFFAIGILMLLRFSNLSVRLSDTNIYFYTAYEILNGKLLYKDIFFTNLPLFPYLSSFYLIVSQKNILFYYFTSTIEVSLISLLIYYLVYKKTKDYFMALLSSFFYLLSFMVLSTSEHQTGVFTASLFAVGAYLFYEKKKYIIMGILLAAMLLLKAYFLPVAASFFFTLLIQKKYTAFFKGIISCFVISTIVFLPFLIFAQKEFYTDIVLYSLTRAAGVSKIDIAWFFISKDTLLFLLLIFNIFNYKKDVFFCSLSIFSFLFFLFYKDTYYLYFNFLIPFLALSLPNFLTFLQTKLHAQKFVFPTILFIFLCINVFSYITSYRNLGKISHLPTLLKSIQEHKPSALYGTNDITPALAFLTQTPLLNSIVDTNESIFRKKFLNADVLTQDAIEQKAMVVTHGVFYPEAGITEKILEGIFNKKMIEENCKGIASVPVFSEGITNRIYLFTCK